MIRLVGNRNIRRALAGVLGGVVALGFWVGGDAVYHHYDLKNRINVYMRDAQLKSELEVRRELFNMLRVRGVECPEDKISVHRGEGEIQVALEYRYPLGIDTAKGRFIVYSMTATVAVERAFSG